MSRSLSPLSGVCKTSFLFGKDLHSHHGNFVIRQLAYGSYHHFCRLKDDVRADLEHVPVNFTQCFTHSKVASNLANQLLTLFGLELPRRVFVSVVTLQKSTHYQIKVLLQSWFFLFVCFFPKSSLEIACIKYNE